MKFTFLTAAILVAPVALAAEPELQQIVIPQQSVDLYKPHNGAYICPNLLGNYSDGETIKNSDGTKWTLKIAEGGSLNIVTGEPWSQLYLHQDLQKDAYTFTCAGRYTDKQVAVSLTIKTAATCFTVPDLQYPQFACY